MHGRVLVELCGKKDILMAPTTYAGISKIGMAFISTVKMMAPGTIRWRVTILAIPELPLSNNYDHLGKVRDFETWAPETSTMYDYLYSLWYVLRILTKEHDIKTCQSLPISNWIY